MITRRRVIGLCASCAAAALQFGRSSGWPLHKGMDQCKTTLPDAVGSFSEGCLLLDSPTQKKVLNKKYSFTLENNLQTYGMFTIEIAVTEILGIDPDFQFFEDTSGPNAFATPLAITGNCSKYGVVFVGKSLIKGEVEAFDDGAATALALIVAHECAHILQFKREIKGKTPILELHADYIAGWVMGIIYKKEQKNGTAYRIKMESAAQSIYSKGSYDFTNPLFHGTPIQRRNIMISGFKSAIFGQLDLEDVISNGWEAAKELYNG